MGEYEQGQGQQDSGGDAAGVVVGIHLGLHLRFLRAGPPPRLGIGKQLAAGVLRLRRQRAALTQHAVESIAARPFLRFKLLEERKERLLLL